MIKDKYSFQKHYDDILSKYYTKIFGGRKSNEEKFEQIISNFKIKPEINSTAIDLGAGSGFSSIPLAKLGFNVIAVDLDENLTNEIAKFQYQNIKIINGDILKFPEYIEIIKYDLIICMTDVISHLNSYEEISLLFKNVEKYLSDKGRLLLSFRDQSKDLKNTERFIPFYSDDDIIVTTFLEQSNEFLNVTDIFNIKEDGKWKLVPSSYRKLRLYSNKIKELISSANLKLIDDQTIHGMTYIICSKKIYHELINQV